jgi:tetratricopeptide (TPR) repeat protein
VLQRPSAGNKTEEKVTDGVRCCCRPFSRMAYNKSKFVEAAQKLLNQGKVAQAIAEYQQILKYEPRDQVTLMTIGELYIRQGETFQAIDYFERLAQLFVTDGFLTKAIAVYKRIAKLAPEEIRPLEKLADLYVQQGVMSEARPLFLQLAELHLKNGKQPEAVALLRKLLQAEPDNLRIQVRLADLYQAMGQSNEALETYVSAAQRALARGDQAECEKLADKALQISPKHLDAMIVKARAYSSTGNIAKAAEILERVPDLEKGGESAELLLDLHLKNAKWDEATAFALKIFASDEKNFGAAQKVTQSLLESGQGERAMSILSRIRIPMIDAGEHDGVTHLLNDLATRLPGRLEPLEWLVDTYGRTSDSFRLPDALAQLGDALVSSGKIERARDVFQQLVDREPESDSAKRKLNDVLRKMGLLEGEIRPQPDHAEIVENLQAELPQAPAPKVRPGLNEEPPQVPTQSPSPTPSVPDLDEETQKFIAQSLTDVDLFASYGLTQKAIGLLEAILRRAPMHTPTLEKLLDFVLGAGDDRRTAELAAQLEHIHAQRGDARSSERFGELRRRFQRAAGLTDDEITAAVAASVPQPVETVPVEEVPEAAAAAEPEETPMAAAEIAPAPVQHTAPKTEVVEELSATPALQEEEVDLSSEWASVLEETKEPAAPAHAQPVPEIHAAPVAPAAPAIQEFSLPEFAIQEPVAKPMAPAPEGAETSAPEHLEAASTTKFTPPAPAPLEDEGFNPFAEISAEMPSPETTDIHDGGIASHQEEHLLPDEELTALPVPEHSEVAAEGIEPTLEVPQPPVRETPEPSPEFEVDQDFELILEPETVVPPHELLASMPPAAPQEHQDEPKQEPVRANGNAFGSDQFLSDLAKEIDQLGMGELTLPPALSEAHMADEQAIANKAKESVPGEPGPLKEVFEEFRAELGEMGAEDEDLETHYNLGVAFREMGLLEEAIGEFQKVAKATDRGKAFRYAMQCSTLLGLAFMEKGQPGIAAIWYERALLTPGIDSESKLALRYDLGVAQESAGDLDSALKSFSQVYAVNIDYRDVAERIASLQKPAR